jgi:hypothetical protein
VRVLFLHPADDLSAGPWSNEHWSRVIDLGIAGSNAHARWQAKLGIAVEPLQSFRHNFAEIRRVGELLSMGSGQLIDADGLDWWDLNSILVHEQLETVVVLKRVVDTIEAVDEVYVTRDGFHANALRALLRRDVVSIRPGDPRGLGHYLRVARKFPLWQLTQIYWDKYDPGFQLRRRFAPKRKPSEVPVVLLPSAYINVSRTALAYASAVPEVRFLLTATRQSACMANLPSNVDFAWLSSFASPDSKRREDEYCDIVQGWPALRQELQKSPEFTCMFELGLVENFGERIRHGLQIRDGWKNVFEREPVQSVLCADDTNPYTRIPLLLARKRGLPAMSCHHGALDGRYMFKQRQADVILAKGRMEHDYLVRVCGVPAGEVEVGAPPRVRKPEIRAGGQHATSPIVFFSEPYETFSGRGREVYRDVLPPLADLAAREGRELIVKLHPAESEQERSKMVRDILTSAQRKHVSIRSGVLAPEFLSQIWFGVTVLSTVAIECAQLGVPCFLCDWLEFWPYGYIDQFIRFGVGYRLHNPAELSSIPGILKTSGVSSSRAADLSTPIDPHRLEDLLTRTISACDEPQRMRRAAP